MRGSEQEPIAWIVAMKKFNGGDALQSCPIDDPEAIVFCVGYRGMPFSSSMIDFRNDDQPHMAKARAEDVRRALVACHNSGRRTYAKDLREFMGVKE